MSNARVRDSYGPRAAEYTEYVGPVEALAAEDRELIADWAATVRGPVLDAGSGPGHWTAYLSDHDVEAQGIDLVPEFVESASARFPHLRFRVGDFSSLPGDDDSLGGILSWYSVIHTEPADIPVILDEFARVLCPGGTLLIAFFVGPQVERFAHAITTAWSWPIDTMEHELARAGFDILETHARTHEGARSHGAVLARRQDG